MPCTSKLPNNFHSAIIESVIFNEQHGIISPALPIRKSMGKDECMCVQVNYLKMNPFEIEIVPFLTPYLRW